MILIDATYVNELGGKNLLEYFLKSIDEKRLTTLFFVLLDKRISLKLSNLENYFYMEASESNRLKFYKKNSNKFSKIFCFANVPPPINLKIDTFIYFHNDLLIDIYKTDFSFKRKIVFLLKRFYIKLRNRKNYKWLVQTDLIKEKLSQKMAINKSRILTLPFYFENFTELKKEKPPNSFLYVSGYLPHKNHLRLVKAFVVAAEKFNKSIYLNLTLKKNDFNTLMKSFSKVPSNLVINNLGVLNLEEINLAYENNENMIFPSLKESLGLPLIEATLKQLYVLCSNLEYTHYVIEPSLSFNPLEIEDISNSIYKTLTLNDLNKPKLIIKNKIDQIINMLTSVQK